MDTNTTTYWYRDWKGTSEKDALVDIDSEHELYDSREEAERAEPDSEYRTYHTYEIAITDHGPAPEPTWWWATWVKVHAVPDREESFEVGPTTFDYPALEFEHSRHRTLANCRVLATSEADARAKAIEAWREAGFLPVLERAGLEVGE
jgi:hypothetical protein